MKTILFIFLFSFSSFTLANRTPAELIAYCPTIGAGFYAETYGAYSSQPISNACNVWSAFAGACFLPNNTPYSIETINCPVVEPVVCPSANTAVEQPICVKVADIQVGQVVNLGTSSGIFRDAEGCGFTPQISNRPDNYEIQKNDVDGNEEICMMQTFIATGVEAPAYDVQQEPVPSYISDDFVNELINDSTYAFNEVSNTTITNPDSSVTDTVQTLETSSTASETQENTGSASLVNPTLHSTTTTTTTTTNPDNSKSVTETINYNTTTSSTYTFNGSTNQLSSTFPTSTDSSQTNTSSYDPSGELISSSQSGGSSPTATLNEPPCVDPNGCEDFKEILEEVSETQKSEIETSLAEKETALTDVFDGVITSLTDGSLKETYGINDTILGDQLASILPSSTSCANIVMGQQGLFPAWEITCAQTEVIRDFLSWALYLFFAMFLFSTFTHSLDGISK